MKFRSSGEHYVPRLRLMARLVPSLHLEKRGCFFFLQAKKEKSETVEGEANVFSVRCTVEVACWFWLRVISGSGRYTYK